MAALDFYYSPKTYLGRGKYRGVREHALTTKSRLLRTLKRKPSENIVGKGENAGNQHFLLFPQCFLPFPKLFSNF